ncbi:hypothetical protein G5714_018279 [Onychostoma macrolepis]|uniref:Uncharacterized protein n=1 Tax=Onychostoma macrolepis TaxID=369639 RepID=A0A7J6BZZ5_9TELE|nr:hypothetical protein G5714_018279 [Onychostoma macrolepis]
MPPPPKPACSNHSAPLPLENQDQDPLLTPTLKRRARMKRALQSAASIHDSDTFPVTPESAGITHVSLVAVKSTDVISQTFKSVPVISESVESTSTFPEIVKSAADISIPAKPTPVTPEPVKPAPVTPDPVKPAPVTPEPFRPAPVTPDPVKPPPVIPEPVNPAPVISKRAKLAAIQSLPVNSKPESTSVIPESVTFRNKLSTTVITQSIKFAPDTSESINSIDRSQDCPITMSSWLPRPVRPVPAPRGTSSPPIGPILPSHPLSFSVVVPQGRDLPGQP